MLLRRLVVSAVAVLAASALQAAELRVLSHSSFSVNKQKLAEFEQKNGVKVSIIKAGDAGEMLNKLILTKSAPIADVVYGIDNLLLAKAQSAGVLERYTAPTSANVRSFKLGDALTPVDYGWVMLNVDKAYVAQHKLALPKTLEDLTQPAYKGMLVVENPATSSTGLAFLAATVNHFGEQKAWAFWEKLRDNDLKITQGWTEAYEKEFSRNGGKRPFVVSYQTSPAAELFYSEGKLKEPPTDNLYLPGSRFMQVEGVALVKGGKEAALGKAFIAFLQSEGVQQELPTSMWMFPVLQTVKLDDSYRFAQAPQGSNKNEQPVVSQNAQQLQDWVARWTRIMRP
ncbi:MULTISPECIES: thiamine ABC transporter substrate-binding protein [Leeia]|uniref:Thiamine ABC transporter substrate-binding protein n=1 Tax=Leeia aquatica TaxID=2725557 RepID=A0A847RVM3_9NEIS|nr:thiamine ABC transporter substrate-binding protein [Leeia aquatica]NLR73871.1 thiamine ABC transporter substrate-binding protein [Leeia aquatica]